MARIITVTDDESGVAAQIEIQAGSDGHRVRRLTVSSEAPSGLPDELVDALVPYIGLPAGPVNTVAHPHGVPDPGDPARPPVAAAVFTAPALAAGNGHEPKKKRKPGGSEPKYPVPSERELTKAMTDGLGSAKYLADRFDVPYHVAYRWTQQWRKRQNAK